MMGCSKALEGKALQGDCVLLQSNVLLVLLIQPQARRIDLFGPFTPVRPKQSDLRKGAPISMKARIDFASDQFNLISWIVFKS